MTVSEDFTSLTGRFRGELLAHRHLFTPFGLPPRYGAGAAGPAPAPDATVPPWPR